MTSVRYNRVTRYDGGVAKVEERAIPRPLVPPGDDHLPPSFLAPSVGFPWLSLKTPLSAIPI